jgi:hypothetical protein
MSKEYTLSTGVVVEVSDRKSNRSGYTGAALSPSWTLDSTRPFIAACGNPSDPKVMAVVNAQHRTSLHIGSYKDAREAAYVVGMYRKDPIATITKFQSNGNFTDFPEDLYSLPVGLEYEAAVAILNANKTAKKNKVQTVVKDTKVPAAGNLYDFFERAQVVDIAKKLGGAEQFQSAIKGLTIEQFADKFELTTV